jgi:hypothetical protein
LSDADQDEMRFHKTLCLKCRKIKWHRYSNSSKTL